MARISRRTVDAAKPDKERDVIIWDDSLVGFGLRVKPSGVRSYIIQYRNSAGLSRRLTLGRHESMTPDQARRQAQELLAAAAAGGDPAREKREASQAWSVKAAGRDSPVPQEIEVTRGIDELRQFKIFAELHEEDFNAIGGISRVCEYESAEKLTVEGAPADHLYLFLKGRASVKIKAPDGRQVLIDQLGEGEVLGWGAVMEPHVYTASAWTIKPSQVIVVDGARLRELCESNQRIGYQVAKGIGEVMSRRFGQAVTGRGGQVIGGWGIDELHQFKIFAELDVADLDAIARIANIREIEPGEELTTEGAPAEQMYLFLRGKAEVKVRGADGREVLIDELGPGELLGWGAIMEPHVYTASAWTTEPSEVIVINGGDLRDLCETNKRIGYQVAKGIGEVMSRRFGQAVGGAVGQVVTKQGGKIIGVRGIEALQQFKLFAELEAADLDAIARISHVRMVQPGEELTTEGAPADQLYLFLQGKAEVKVRGADGRQVLIDELGPGEMLGWGAVMEPHVYTASAWTTEQSELYVVNGIRLRQLCETNKQIGYQVAKGIGEVISRRFGHAVGGRGGHALGGRGIDELHQFRIFAELDVADLEAISGISQVKLFDTGAELTVEGAPAEYLYLFLKGEATVKVRSSDGSQHVIDELGAGEVLGWSAVMEPHRYTASAWTTEPTEAIVIKGEDLRELCDENKRMGYQVVKGIGEVMSKRFGQALGGRGFNELHQFKIFSALNVADLDAVARICHFREFPADQELTVEGAKAERLYLFSKGKAVVKVRSPEGGQVLIDELEPGDILGWSAVMEPYTYTASAWTAEPSELIVVDGERLRRLCEANKHVGYEVVKGIGEVISRRFGQAMGEYGDLREKDLRALSGEERVIWDNGELQLTTRAVLIDTASGSPDVIPLEAVYSAEVQGDCVLFHVHGGDVCSPSLEDPALLAALAEDAVRRTRYAGRRKGYYSGGR